MYPVPVPYDWTKTTSPDIDPPIFTKQPGRPKKNRRKSKDEGSVPTGRGRMTTITCSNCKRQGHKYTSCAQKLKPELELRKTKHKSNKTMPEDAGSSAQAPAAQAPQGQAGPTQKLPSVRRGRTMAYFTASGNQ